MNNGEVPNSRFGEVVERRNITDNGLFKIPEDWEEKHFLAAEQGVERYNNSNQGKNSVASIRFYTLRYSNARVERIWIVKLNEQHQLNEESGVDNSGVIKIINEVFIERFGKDVYDLRHQTLYADTPTE